jgi:uncharacterized protein involved in tolerance to divalent cations
MNELEKLFNEKRTENGDISYKSTGDNLTDLFFMTPFFEKHLDQVKIGNTDREKVFSMFVRDPRFGLGRRDLGRKLMELSGVDAHNVVKAGRFDDLWHNPTDRNIAYLWACAQGGNELAKKWMPRLTGKDKKIAKALCKMFKMSEKEYRALIKTSDTTEYKLSYAVKKEDSTPLEDLFGKNKYAHPLVNEINFEKVPSLAMTKYLHTFSTREDLKDRFAEYITAVKENKAKVNVSTTNVVDAYKTANKSNNEANDVIGKKIVENATLNVEMNCIPILDTSGSMFWTSNGINIGEKATAVAHALATHSTYAKNQLISFSSYPKLMTIKGDTLQEQYRSMYTGDCSNTDFGKVMNLLQGLNKFPEYLVVLSDMEFDYGSSMSKEKTMRLFKEKGAETKIIWWNFNDRNKTVPEFDEYGNIFISGYNMQILKLLENKFDMSSYIDKILEDYKKKVGM